MVNRVIRTIKESGGNYSTIVAWEQDTEYNLVSSGSIEEGHLSVHSTGWDEGGAVDMHFATCDAEHYRILRAAPGEEHGGVSGAGPVVIMTASDTMFNVRSEDFSVVSGISFDGQLFSSATNGVSINGGTAQGTVFDSCMVYNLNGNGMNSNMNSPITTIRNCIVFRNARHGISVGGAGSTTQGLLYVHNNTSYDNDLGAGGWEGLQLFNCSGWVSNNVSAGHDNTSSNDFTDGGTLTLVGSGNASEDATAFGTSPTTGIVVADNFTDADGGDFSVKDTSADIYNAGVIPTFTPVGQAPSGLEISFVDIAETARPQSSTWDIGAFELVAVAAAVVADLTEYVTTSNGQQDCSGTYVIRDGKFFIPVVASVQDTAQQTSSLVFVKNSGILAIYDGTDWRTKVI